MTRNHGEPPQPAPAADSPRHHDASHHQHQDHEGGHQHHHAHPHDHHHGPSAHERAPSVAGAFVANQGAHPDALGDALGAGSGQGQVLFFDAFSGIAGDMTVAALVHLGIPFSVVRDAIAALGIAGCQVSMQRGRVGALAACKFEVHGTDTRHERHLGEIIELIDQSSLDDGTKRLACQIFHRLAGAEARVHDIPVERVHFHEVGAIDAIADIVGASAAIQYLGAEVIASPLPLGHGFVKCRHGVIPLPAPATVECLRGVPTYAANIEVETVTPTGAAIISTISRQFTRWPALVPQRIGWGAGTHVFEGRPDVLRVVLGKLDTTEPAAAHGHVVLEANVDDMTGELSGHALTLLMQAGALDAWVVPITMKKGRPGVVLSAIVAPADSIRLSELILRETTTLGVRRTEAARMERPRRIIVVATRYGAVAVKVAEGPFGPIQLKPEFDECAQLAQKLQVPVREIIAEALIQARIQVTGG